MCNVLGGDEKRLLERLEYWEWAIEIPVCAHPDPVVRLDHLMESILSEAPADGDEVTSLKRENKRLRYRWTSLRKLLGIVDLEKAMRNVSWD